MIVLILDDSSKILAGGPVTCENFVFHGELDVTSDGVADQFYLLNNEGIWVFKGSVGGPGHPTRRYADMMLDNCHLRRELVVTVDMKFDVRTN